MAAYLTNDTDLTAVAQAVRVMGGTSAALKFPDGYIKAITALPVEKPQENLLRDKAWVRGYFNDAGEIKTPGYGMEMTSDFVPLPKDPSDCLLFVTKLPENAGSSWGAYILYDGNKAILGTRKTFNFVERAADGNRKLIWALSDLTETGAAFLRLSFRTYGTAEVYLGRTKVPARLFAGDHSTVSGDGS